MRKYRSAQEEDRYLPLKMWLVRVLEASDNGVRAEIPHGKSGRTGLIAAEPFSELLRSTLGIESVSSEAVRQLFAQQVSTRASSSTSGSSGSSGFLSYESFANKLFAARPADSRSGGAGGGAGGGVGESQPVTRAMSAPSVRPSRSVDLRSQRDRRLRRHLRASRAHDKKQRQSAEKQYESWLGHATQASPGLQLQSLCIIPTAAVGSHVFGRRRRRAGRRRWTSERPLLAASAAGPGALKRFAGS